MKLAKKAYNKVAFFTDKCNKYKIIMNRHLKTNNQTNKDNFTQITTKQPKDNWQYLNTLRHKHNDREQRTI